MTADSIFTVSTIAVHKLSSVSETHRDHCPLSTVHIGGGREVSQWDISIHHNRDTNAHNGVDSVLKRLMAENWLKNYQQHIANLLVVKGVAPVFCWDFDLYLSYVSIRYEDEKTRGCLALLSRHFMELHIYYIPFSGMHSFPLIWHTTQHKSDIWHMTLLRLVGVPIVNKKSREWHFKGCDLIPDIILIVDCFGGCPKWQ